MPKSKSKSKPKPASKSKPKPASKPKLAAPRPKSGPPTPSGPPGPESLLQMQFAMAASKVLTVGVRLSVFTHLSTGQNTAAAVARAASASERGTRMLLDTLCAFQLLTKSGASYGLSPLAERFLVRTSPDYMGHFIESDRMWQSWSRLEETIRSGKPVHRVEDKETAEAFFPVLVQSLHVVNREPARRAARSLVGGRRGLRAIDIACGSGIWGIAVAEADEDARVTAQDFPGVLETTRKFVEKHGVQARFDFLPGDLKNVDLGKDRFDLALLGNILHSEGERSSRDLLRRLSAALRKGGKVAIADMVPNDERTGPPFPTLFALNMLLHTEVGDCYTLADYTAWMKEAGFARVETVDIASHSPLIVGIKG